MHLRESVSYFTSGSVILDLKSREKYKAINELIDKTPIFRAAENFNIESFRNKVIEREKIQSTGIGHGVAVGHGRVEGINSIYLTLGISQEGIEYNAIDNNPVHLLFLIANNPKHQIYYLRILSALVSMVRAVDFREEILCCCEQEKVEQLLCDNFEHHLTKYTKSFVA
jgi:PTS system nitrogen regulatory IIA component